MRHLITRSGEASMASDIRIFNAPFGSDQEIADVFFL